MPRSMHIGRAHRVACIDLTSPGARIPARYDYLLTDLPWGAGTTRGFRTKAGIDDGKVDYRAFLGTIARIAAAAPEVWIEIGARELRDTINIVGASHQPPQVFDITYYKTKPCKLIHWDSSKCTGLAVVGNSTVWTTASGWLPSLILFRSELQALAPTRIKLCESKRSSYQQLSP